MVYDSNKITKDIYLQLAPETTGTYVRGLSLISATSRRPKQPTGTVVHVALRFDRHMFDIPTIEVDVTDNRLSGEAGIEISGDV